jgi:hypothetical protein
MAEENKNTGPQNIDPKQFAAGLKNLLDSQGDYNNLLKDAIRELGQMDRAYNKIEARLATLNSDSINIKQVNRDLLLLKQKEYIEEKKLTDLQKSVDPLAKQALSIAKENTRILMQEAAILGEKLDYEETMLKYLEDTGDLEAAALYAQEKKLEISQKQVEIGRASLANEKSVSKQLGISGNLMKAFAEKIGFGEEAYSAMSLKARKLVEQQKDMNAVSKVFSKVLGTWQVAAAGAGSVFKSAFSSILDPAMFIPIVGGVVQGLKTVFDYILGIQDKTVKFARAMNLSTAEARTMKMQFADISISEGDILVTSQKLVESQMEMVDALGVTNRLTDEQLATNIKLKDIAGLDLETRKSLVETSKITGKDQEDITKSILAQVVGLKNATGISFQYQKILKEASNLGGYLGLTFAKYPEKLTKSLLTVKAMGMELKQLDSIADSFLDFESSISSEFEAQLLTGKDINLAKARELFLNNQLAEAAQEITSQVGSAEDFLKMNRIQAESLAKAFGMSRDQLGDMLTQQEFLSKLGAKQGDSAKEQLRLGLEKYKNQKALAAAVGEEAYQNLLNASAQEKIAAFLDKVTQSFSDFVEKSGVIEKIEQFVNYLSEPKNIKAVISTIRDVFADIAGVVLSITNGIINVVDFLTFGSFPEELERKFERYEELVPQKIRSIGGNFESVSVSANAAKGNASASTVNVSQGSMGGAAYTGPKVLELNVTGKINTQDERTFASFTAKGLSTPYGNSDLQTGNYNAF